MADFDSRSHVSKWLLWSLVTVYGVMWVGGIGSHLLRGGPRPEEKWAAPLFLLLAGLIIALTAAGAELKSLAVMAGVGFASEIIGVRYGFLFGSYSYTEQLSPLLLGVPLVMASAWMVLAAYVKQVVLLVRPACWVDVPIASLWMTAIDLVIDPLAAGELGYWRWADGGGYYGVPAQNFLGWFAVSLFVFTLAKALNARGWQPNPWALHTGLSIILFFTTLAAIYRLRVAAAVGLALASADITLRSLRAIKQNAPKL